MMDLRQTEQDTMLRTIKFIYTIIIIIIIIALARCI